MIPTLSTADFIYIPYTPDLIKGGIGNACCSLAHTHHRMSGSPVERLQRMVGSVAVELAFRRHLWKQGVPFDVLGSPPSPPPTAMMSC